MFGMLEVCLWWTVLDLSHSSILPIWGLCLTAHAPVAHWVAWQVICSGRFHMEHVSKIYFYTGGSWLHYHYQQHGRLGRVPKPWLGSLSPGQQVVGFCQGPFLILWLNRLTTTQLCMLSHGWDPSPVQITMHIWPSLGQLEPCVQCYRVEVCESVGVRRG